MVHNKQIGRGSENKQIDIGRLRKQPGAGRRENMLIRNELALAEVAHTSCHSKIPTLTILSTSISKPTKISNANRRSKTRKGRASTSQAPYFVQDS